MHPASRYILWTADAIDTLIQKYAPHNIATMYKEVRFVVQRVDIARFFLLYIYGGLYVDLDVLSNREVYPQVYAQVYLEVYGEVYGPGTVSYTNMTLPTTHNV